MRQIGATEAETAVFLDSHAMLASSLQITPCTREPSLT